MTPFEIVFIACLVANPAQCTEHRIPYESAGSIKQCATEGQGPVAQWFSEHPEMQVKRYGCEITGIKQPSNS